MTRENGLPLQISKTRIGSLHASGRQNLWIAFCRGLETADGEPGVSCIYRSSRLAHRLYSHTRITATAVDLLRDQRLRRVQHVHRVRALGSEGRFHHHGIIFG